MASLAPQIPPRGAHSSTEMDATQQTIPSPGWLKLDSATPQPDETSVSFSSRPQSSCSHKTVNSEAVSTNTLATSQLPPLQNLGLGDDENDDFKVLDEDTEPASFDLVTPAPERNVYSIERRSEMLFSEEHMASILEDTSLLRQFTHFLSTKRPASMPLLTYYLHTEKAIRAIKYANSIIQHALTPMKQHDFSLDATDCSTSNVALLSKHRAAFEALTKDELPMFITHMWIQVVSQSMKRRITGTLPPQLREASEGLAEVFCLTDPSRHDNPIIMASDEFHRTTQYGVNYVIGRNCRFLQGPGTNPFSVQRIRDKLAAGVEHFETFLNYRRDGSPFLNLLLCAPLLDSRGNVRYFLGAQVDVSGLAKECVALEGLKRIVKKGQSQDDKKDKQSAVEAKAKTPAASSLEGCRDMCAMFDRDEVEMVRIHGGVMHRTETPNITGESKTSSANTNWGRQYVVIEDSASPIQSPGEPPATAMLGKDTAPKLNQPSPRIGGRLTGVYEHYLLVRPAPSLQILFASPSLRVPGMLQSPFLSRIGGSGHVRDQIARALTDGQGVTARVRWVSSTRYHVPQKEKERSRWIHCTPLRGVNDAIGVWMVVIVDEETSEVLEARKEAEAAAAHANEIDGGIERSGRLPRTAPKIDAQIRSIPSNAADIRWSQAPSIKST